MSTTICSPTKRTMASHELPLAELLLLIGISKQQIVNASKASYTQRITPSILGSYPKNASISEYPYISNINMVSNKADLL